MEVPTVTSVDDDSRSGIGKITVNVDLNLQSNMILLVHSMIFKYQSLMQLDVEASVLKIKKRYWVHCSEWRDLQLVVLHKKCFFVDQRSQEVEMKVESGKKYPKSQSMLSIQVPREIIFPKSMSVSETLDQWLCLQQQNQPVTRWSR